MWKKIIFLSVAVPALGFEIRSLCFKHLWPTELIVAAKDLPTGATLTPGTYEVKHVRPDECPSPFIISSYELQRASTPQVLVHAVKSGTPILQTDLTPASSLHNAPMKLIAPSSKHAYIFKLDRPFGQFDKSITAGNHIEIVQWNSKDKSKKRVIIRDARVLDTMPGIQKGKTPGTLAIIALNFQEAEQLNNALNKAGPLAAIVLDVNSPQTPVRIQRYQPSPMITISPKYASRYKLITSLSQERKLQSM